MSLFRYTVGRKGYVILANVIVIFESLKKKKKTGVEIVKLLRVVFYIP